MMKNLLFRFSAMLLVVIIGVSACAPKNTPTVITEGSDNPQRIQQDPISVPNTIVATTTPEVLNPTPTIVSSQFNTLAFSDDFENGNKNFLLGGGSGSFQVVDDGNGNKVLELSDAGTDSLLVNFGPKKISDCVIEYRVRFNTKSHYPGTANLMLRSTELGRQTYVFAFDKQYQTSLFYYYPPWESIKSFDININPGTWYDIRVEMDGENLNASIDGVPVLQATDSRLISGNFGFQIYSNTTIDFDDVKIWTRTSIAIPTAPVIALQDAMLFEQDFESGNPETVSELYAKWFVPWHITEDEGGNHVYCNDPSDPYLSFSFGNNAWKDYAVELRVKSLNTKSNSSASLYARWAHQGYYGSWRFESQKGNLALDDPFVGFGETPIQAAQNEWHTMRLEVAGTAINYYFDDQLILDGDDDFMSNGKGAFMISPNSSVCVDDIRMWALDTNGAIALPPLKDMPLETKLESFRIGDVYPQVWSHNSPRGKAFEYKVNCDKNFQTLETCFLWEIDQVIVTTPQGVKYSLNKDFNIQSYSGETTRRWVLYGPYGSGLPENGTYIFTFMRNNQIEFAQEVVYSQSILDWPTEVSLKQEGNGLHVKWLPPQGVTSETTYKVIIFDNQTGQIVASQLYPADSRDIFMPNLPLIPGRDYYVNVPIYSHYGFAESEQIYFKWLVP